LLLSSSYWLRAQLLVLPPLLLQLREAVVVQLPLLPPLLLVLVVARAAVVVLEDCEPQVELEGSCPSAAAWPAHSALLTHLMLLLLPLAAVAVVALLLLP
jgi:hypothetical protein